MSQLRSELKITAPYDRQVEYNALIKLSSRRLERAFACGVIGLFLVPILLNFYSLSVLFTIDRKDLQQDDWNRYVFTWLLNMGAIAVHTIFLLNIFD